MPATQILLTHLYSDSNPGDAAIILGSISALRSQYPSATLVAMSTFASTDPRYSTEHRHVLPHFESLVPSLFPGPVRHHAQSLQARAFSNIIFFFHFGRSLLLLLACLISPALARPFLAPAGRKSLQAICRSNFVVCKGGGYFYDYGGLRNLLFFYRMVFPLLLSQAIGKKVVLLGHTIGPLKSVGTRFLLRWAISRNSTVILRDRPSLALVSKLESGSKLMLAPDMAFAMRCFPASAMESELPISLPQSNLFGITVRQWHAHRGSRWDHYRDYLLVLARTCFDLVSGGYGTPVLVSQVTGPTAAEDDRGVTIQLHQILTEMNLPCIRIPDADFSPGQLVSLYARLDFLIATRMHSAILSALSHTPSVLIEYAGHKAFGLAEYLDLPAIRIYNLSSSSLVNSVATIVTPSYREAFSSKVAQTRKLAVQSMRSVPL